MKAIFLLISTGLLLVACAKTDLTPGIDNSNLDWIRLTVPSGGETMNIAGNLDSTLFVATMFMVYRTTDQGRSWTMIRDRKQGPTGVLVSKDTLILMGGRQGNQRAISASEYSLDEGKTWRNYYQVNSRFPGKVLNQAEAPDGSTYIVKENSTPINSTSAYINPSTLLRESKNATTEVTFPFKHIITAIQLDSKHRLYVTVSGEHVPETNRIISGDFTKPAYLYISKRPLP